MGASEAKRKKQNKKNENETKNIFGYVLDGIKECNGQDSFPWEYMMATEQKEKKHLSL